MSPKIIDDNSKGKNDNIKIHVDFLGSCHYAYETPGAGTPYKGNRHVYIRGNKGKNRINFTFSGPTILDIKKPTIKSITLDAQAILMETINELLQLDSNCSITIRMKGHSRGAIVAKNVFAFLKKKFETLKPIMFEPLILADPYAGPINRLVASVDTINMVDSEVNVVYSLVERKYSVPSKILNAKVVIFTDCSHGTTRYISACSGKLVDGTYAFVGDPKKLRSIALQLKTVRTLGEVKKINQEIKKYVNPRILKITNPAECWLVLKLFNKIATSRRKEIFYKRMYEISDCKETVANYLKENNEKSLLKKISKD